MYKRWDWYLLGVWEVVVDLLVHDIEDDIQEIPASKSKHSMTQYINLFDIQAQQEV